jgi:hypothetical protein
MKDALDQYETVARISESQMRLAKGANVTHSYVVTHPSQPNDLALFSGSNTE